MPPAVVRTGPLVVDLAAGRVTVAGAPVAVMGLEWRLLAYLARHVGRACSNEQIIAGVWGPEWVCRQQRPHGHKGGLYRPDLAMVGTYVHRLRRRLGPAAGGLIVTVRGSQAGIGFRRLEAVPPEPV